MVVEATGNSRPIVVAGGGGGTPTPVVRRPGRNYGVPKVDFGEGLARIRSGGMRPPALKEKVRRHIEGMMVAEGKKLTAKLPDAYRAELNKTVDTFRRAGRNEEELAALRFAVAQKLTQMLR